MTIKEIETALRESAELRDSILHETYASTVALLAVTDHEQVGSLQLAGSGTLVQVGDSLYVLTAAHVWEEVLKSASKIGITLPEDLNHRFLMEECDLRVNCSLLSRPSGVHIPSRYVLTPSDDRGVGARAIQN